MSITFTRLADLGVTPINDDPAYKELMALDLPDEVIGMAAQLLSYLVSARTPTDIHYEEGKGVGFAQGLSFAGVLDPELEDGLKQVFRKAAKHRLDQRKNEYKSPPDGYSLVPASDGALIQRGDLFWLEGDA